MLKGTNLGGVLTLSSVAESSTHWNQYIRKGTQSDHKLKNENQEVIASLNNNLPFIVVICPLKDYNKSNFLFDK